MPQAISSICVGCTGSVPRVWGRYCKDCHNARRREKYATDEAHRRRRIDESTKRDPAVLKQWHAANKDKTKARLRADKLARYGITIAEYMAMYDAQSGVCKICARVNADDTALCVDHDHLTGRVRGLLCRHCNLLLGNVDDDPARLRAMADYLEEGA